MLYETNHYYYISMWRFIIFKILRKTCNFLMEQLIFMPEQIKMWYLYRWGLFSKSFEFYGGIFIENLQLGHHLLTNLYSSNLVSFSGIHVVFTILHQHQEHRKSISPAHINCEIESTSMVNSHESNLNNLRNLRFNIPKALPLILQCVHWPWMQLNSFFAVCFY